MLKKLKQATLRSLKSAGVSSIVHNSRWRRERLLILAYHGISTHDEHLWDDSLFMPVDIFRRRLQLIKRSGCVVLPLSEGVERMYANDLPERSVVITFDDGTQDFSRAAFPLLQQFGFPATVYLSTFYSEFNRPVFDVMCAYLLWRGRARVLCLKELIQREDQFDLQFAGSRQKAMNLLSDFAKGQGLSAGEKDQLLSRLAKELYVDYAELIERRAMQLLNADEVKTLASAGVDFQLHTHRHRTPQNRELFIREIEDNRRVLLEMTGRHADHFCYPSGVYELSFLPWLKEAGIVSATTCDFGLASSVSNPLLLPRLVDVSSLSEIEFESCLSGVSAALPRRREQRIHAVA